MDDELADIPPEEFVAARDRLAKELKAAGKTAEAAEVKKRRKPSVTEWVARRVQVDRADVVDILRVATKDVAAAQEAAMTGGDREGLRQATTARREALKAVGRAIDEVLASSGRPGHHRDEVLGVIEAAVVTEVSSGTFGVRDDLELPTPAAEPQVDPAAERRAAAAKAAVEAAEARVREAKDELAAAEAALHEARQRLDN